MEVYREEKICKEMSENPPPGVPLDSTAPSPADVTDDGDFLLCANCLNLVTSRRAAMTVDGSHQHTFANPSGMVYTIGCFRWAPGCGVVGEASAEFSWFSGFLWRVAVCTACRCHLGWRFLSCESSFYGLIMDHLVEARSEGGDM